MSKIPWNSMRKESKHLENSTHGSVFIKDNPPTKPLTFYFKKVLKSVLKTLRNRFLREILLFYYRYTCVNENIVNTNLNRITIA